MPSLILQRQAIDRKRVHGILMVVLGGFLLLVQVALLVVDGPRWAEAAEGALCLAIAISGVVGLVRARRLRREFEAREGRDAGVQYP